MHNYTIINVDTDSITYCNNDMSPFTDEEYQRDINELNSCYPDLIKFTDDGSYDVVVVLKAKNYVLYNNGKRKIKGAALKCTSKSPAEREFVNKVIDTIIDTPNLEEMHIKIKDIYNSFIREACNIQDISRWAAKKNITSKVLKNERTNEVNVRNAIEGSEYVEGDRVYLFTNKEGNLTLVENFQQGDYDVDTMLKKLYNTFSVFKTILPKELFVNYTLKKNKKLLEAIMSITSP